MDIVTKVFLSAGLVMFVSAIRLALLHDMQHKPPFFRRTASFWKMIFSSAASVAIICCFIYIWVR